MEYWKYIKPDEVKRYKNSGHRIERTRTGTYKVWMEGNAGSNVSNGKRRTTGINNIISHFGNLKEQSGNNAPEIDDFLNKIDEMRNADSKDKVLEAYSKIRQDLMKFRSNGLIDTKTYASIRGKLKNFMVKEKGINISLREINEQIKTIKEHIKNTGKKIDELIPKGSIEDLRKIDIKKPESIVSGFSKFLGKRKSAKLVSIDDWGDKVHYKVSKDNKGGILIQLWGREGVQGIAYMKDNNITFKDSRWNKEKLALIVKHGEEYPDEDNLFRFGEKVLRKTKSCIKDVTKKVKSGLFCSYAAHDVIEILKSLVPFPVKYYTTPGKHDSVNEESEGYYMVLRDGFTEYYFDCESPYSYSIYKYEKGKGNSPRILLAERDGKNEQLHVYKSKEMSDLFEKGKITKCVIDTIFEQSSHYNKLEDEMGEDYDDEDADVEY